MAIDNTNTRKFLDYDGLSKFWEGIKSKFADINTVSEIQSDIQIINQTISDISETTNDQLTQLLGVVSRLSPLSATNYSDALEKAKTALLGSVIYVEAIDPDYPNYQIGPYIVTKSNSLLYINTYEGNVDLDTSDLSTILSTLGAIQTQIDEFPSLYVDKQTFAETIDELRAQKGNLSIDVVDELPNEGTIGTIYLVKTKDNVSGNITDNYIEYICVNIDGLGKVYEKIGSGTADLTDYVTSERFDEVIASINKSISDQAAIIKADIQEDIISMSNDSFGKTMSIPDDMILDLISK
jgi:hypothetical protein